MANKSKKERSMCSKILQDDKVELLNNELGSVEDQKVKPAIIRRLEPRRRSRENISHGNGVAAIKNWTKSLGERRHLSISVTLPNNLLDDKLNIPS